MKDAVLPGSTIGILGGGQLGRMSAMAARSLGYHIHVLDPDLHCAASQVSDLCVPAPFDDAAAAAYLASRCQAVTLEIEKISVDALEAAAKHAPLRPGVQVLHTIQDRSRQKNWIAGKGFPVGPYRCAESEFDLEKAVRELAGPCFVKSNTGGYDGRSQMFVKSPAEAKDAWAALGSAPCIVEKALDLEAELSVQVARRPSGEVAVYPPALNHHEDRILAWSVLPGPLPPDILKKATTIASELTIALGVEGLLVVEMFLLKDGQLLVNELAPRPHNSFHQTERACVTSQFEQHIRAVCNLPLGSVEVIRPAAIINLLGEVWLHGHPPRFDAALQLPGVKLHLYGKNNPRKGRKMGHLSAIGHTPDEAVKLVQDAYRRLLPA